MKRNSMLHFIALLLCSQAYAQAPFQLGVNLDNSGAFVNMIHHTNRYSNARGYDSLGWPTSDFDLVLMDGRPATEWTGTIDDPEQYRVDYSGRYASSFTGAGTVRATGTAVTIENARYDAPSNTTYFDLVVGGYPNANHGLVFLSFTNTRRTASDTLRSGITNLRVNRPGYALTSTRTFTDDYIALCKAANFACYRFYNVQNIWDGEPAYPQKTRWENRKTWRDAAQVSQSTTNGKRDGWCWEYIVELANALKKDIWINVHISCDSNYVAQLATMLKVWLHPSINIYVESSNEVWSPTQATHGPYNQADAQARGITFDQNYARRTVELSRWFAAVFGQNEINKRIRVILAGQHAYNGRSDIHLNYIKNTFGEPKNFIYATSSALYFGSTNASSTDPAAINAGMIADIDGQITNASTSTYRLNHITKAKSWALVGGCTSYEGGPHLPAGGGTTNLNNQILAHRTQAMRDILKRNYLEGWRNLGGGLAMYFTLVSGYNRYGCWGITDDYNKPDRNYKMQAMRDIIGAQTTVREASDAVPTNIRLYPNPSTASLTIETETPRCAVITDVLGRTVWSGEVLQQTNVDVSRWPSGVYLFNASGFTARIVKQ